MNSARLRVESMWTSSTPSKAPESSGNLPCLTTGTSTTCQCTPTSPKLELHDIEELNLWHLHCKLTRTAGACRCKSTERTTSTTKGTGSTQARTLSTPCLPYHGSVHARERQQQCVGVDVDEETTARHHPARPSARRHLPVACPLLSVPEVRPIVSHDVGPRVIARHGIIVMSSRRG